VRDLIAELKQQKTDYSATPGGFPLILWRNIGAHDWRSRALAAGPIASGREIFNRIVLEIAAA
jgi:hypothetical protein